MHVMIKDFYETSDESDEYGGVLIFTGRHAELRFDDIDGTTTVYEGDEVGEGRWLLACAKNGCRASLNRSALDPRAFEGSFTYRSPESGSYSGMWQIEPAAG